MNVSREAQNQWERTPRGKVICPECEHNGYLGGKWVDKHAEHSQCTCGRTITVKGLATHREMMRRHGRPCP